MSPEQPGAGDRPDEARSAFSFGGEDLGYFGAQVRTKGQAGNGRPRQRMALVLAGLVAVVVLAVVAVGARSGGSATGAGARAGAPTSLSRAAYVTTQSSGFQFQLTISGALAGHDITFGGEGAMDERTLEGAMHMQVDGQEIGEVFKNPYVYVHVPAAAQATGGKSWVRANLQSFMQAMGAPDSFSQGNSSPTQMLALLKDSGQVSTLGSESVRGVSTTHYHALVDFNSYASQAPASYRAAIQRYAQQLQRLTGSSSLPIDVWIDAQQRVRRFSTAVKVCTPQGVLDETISMDLFDFGQQPAVVVPDESEVTDLSSALDSQASQALSQLGC